MASQLDAIAALPDQKAKIEQYRAALQTIVSSASVSDSQAFVDHMLSDAVPLVISRQLLSALAGAIATLPADTHKAIAQHALDRIQPRVVSFEEQATLIREALARLHEAEEEYTAAARILAGIDLDSGVRQLGPEYRLEKNIKIAMLYLEDDDAVSAETFIKKASALIGSCKNVGLEMQYKSSYVRILDAKRRFLEAATAYYDLSQAQPREGFQVSEEDLTQALTAACVCCILAKAGPQRSRILANLYKDERTAALPIFPFLQKVYLERILRQDEVEQFSGQLAAHQMATLPDGTTVLARAVIEHNLAAASRLYRNIYFAELGTLLGVPQAQAEATAARMVQEDRLQATIDQVDGLLTFEKGSEPLMQWDEQIHSLCATLNTILDSAALRKATTAAA